MTAQDDQPRNGTPSPLDGIRVLDLSTLLPGPLASLILAEAGADVIKVERPGGDDMTGYEPRVDGEGVAYTLLNRNKRVIRVDLKVEESRDRILTLATGADVVLEQFRPDVAARLGLGYDDVSRLNPTVVYCSITGYGQTGPFRNRAGHDLTYLADVGLLGGVTDADGRPGLPAVLTADVGAGAFPAVMNIVLALAGRERTGRGCHLDVSMVTNLQSFSLNQVASYVGGDGWPAASQDLLSGASPRYQVYETSDGRYLAAAPMEQHFWERFCEIVDLPPELRDERGREADVTAAVTARIAAKPSGHWRKALCDGHAACSIVSTLEEARQAGFQRVPERKGDEPVVAETRFRTPLADALRGDGLLPPPTRVGLDVEWRAR